MSELLRLAFEDGTTGYAYGTDDIRDAMAGSYAEATSDLGRDIEWIVDDLDDDDLPEDPRDQLITVDLGTLSELMRLARIGAQYAGCSVCRRVTLV